MKCIKCNSEIESDDNFCYNCGNWTPKGYSYLKENKDNILNSNVIKTENKLPTLFVLLSLLICITAIISVVRGQKILKPIVYLKKQIINKQFGYTTSIIKTDNNYYNQPIYDIESAYKIIENDLSSQSWQCIDNIDNYRIEENLKNKYKIKRISFCDMETEEVRKIEEVFNRFFLIFPTSIGYLDTLTITNDKDKNKFIAYFQPIHQFVNRNEDINNYNKVNKTQILLNKYYFLNKKEKIKENFYVKDATLESLIAHELGHYITFVALLKEKNITSITLTTKENEKDLEEIIIIINNNSFSNDILNNATNKYNTKYNSNLTTLQLANSISKYAGTKNVNGELIKDETIAEAVHDYYLHKDNANNYSKEIITILKEKLGDSV